MLRVCGGPPLTYHIQTSKLRIAHHVKLPARFGGHLMVLKRFQSNHHAEWPTAPALFYTMDYRVQPHFQNRVRQPIVRGIKCDTFQRLSIITNFAVSYTRVKGSQLAPVQYLITAAHAPHITHKRGDVDGSCNASTRPPQYHHRCPQPPHAFVASNLRSECVLAESPRIGAHRIIAPCGTRRACTSIVPL